MAVQMWERLARTALVVDIFSGSQQRLAGRKGKSHNFAVIICGRPFLYHTLFSSLASAEQNMLR